MFALLTLLTYATMATGGIIIYFRLVKVSGTFVVDQRQKN